MYFLVNFFTKPVFYTDRCLLHVDFHFFVCVTPLEIQMLRRTELKILYFDKLYLLI